MKNIFTIIVLLFCYSIHAQNVGVNTTEPKATLHIKAITDGTQTEGLLIPSLTESQIQAMPMTEEQKGLLIYNKTQDCIQAYTQNEWACLEKSKANYLVAEYVGSTGVWMQNISADGNTIKFKVVNHSTAGFSALNFQNALTLNGASQGLSYTASEDYSNVSLAGGQGKTLIYNITGTPFSYGTLTANFSSLNNSVTAFGTIQVQEQSAVKALSVELLGDYISNKRVTSENKVRLVIHNFSNQPVNNTNLSQVVTLSGVDGLSVAPDQHTSVSIPVGGEVTLEYNLQGVPVKTGTLVAAFNPNTVVSGNANTSKQVNLFSNVSVSNMQIQGDYVVNQAMTATNQVQVTLTNNNDYVLEQINAKDALSLSGSFQNMTVENGQNTDFNIPANGTKVISYVLKGEPKVGGPMTAKWEQAPFGAVSKSKTVAQFNVSPTTFYFSTNQNGSGTINVSSSEPWQYEILGIDEWVTVTGTTGQNGNGTITFTTQPHTSATPEIGSIRIYRTDGNGVKVTIRQPPTDELITNIPQVLDTRYYPFSDEKFSVNGETKQYTVNYNGNWEIHSYPDWIESATKVNNTTLRVTAKPRTEPGTYVTGYLSISYGADYIKRTEIMQKQKAGKCPSTVPSNLRADKGYMVYPYKEQATFDEIATLYEERDGNDDFEDVKITDKQLYSLRKKVIKTDTKSRLFIGPKDDNLRYFKAGVSHSFSPSYWSAYLDTNNIIKSISGVPESIGYYLQYEKPQFPRATMVICVDGLDENTPSKP